MPMNKKLNLNVLDFESVNEPYDETLVDISTIVSGIESDHGEKIPFSKQHQGKEGEYVHIPLRFLKYDKKYQRLLSKNTIKRAKFLDLQALTPLIVFERPTGEKVVVDGQHRSAIAFLGSDENFEVPCILHEHPKNYNINQCENAEAAFFEKLNSSRKNVSSLDKKRAQIIQGDKDAIAFENNLITLGVYTENLGDLSGIEVKNWSKLEEAWNKYGLGKVSLAVRTIKEVNSSSDRWNKDSLSGALIGGLAGIYSLIDKLGDAKAKGLRDYLNNHFCSKTSNEWTTNTAGRLQDILLVRRIVDKYNDAHELGLISNGAKIGERALSRAGFSDPSKIS